MRRAAAESILEKGDPTNKFGTQSLKSSQIESLHMSDDHSEGFRRVEEFDD